MDLRKSVCVSAAAIVCVTIFFFVFVASASAQRVQSNSGGCSWTKTCSAPFTSSVAAGDAASVAVTVSTWETGPQTPTVSDSQGNTYTLVTSNASTFLFCTPSLKAGADTVSSNLGIAQVQSLVALEFKGSCNVDKFITASGSSVAFTTPSVTAAAGDFLVAAVATNVTDTFRSSNLTVEPGPGAIVIADAPQASAGNVSASFSLGSSASWTALLVAFGGSSSAVFNVTATLKWDDGTPVTGTVALAQATSATGTATNSLGSFPLNSTGVATGSITPNTSLPLTFFVTLINTSGSVVNTMTLFANSQILNTLPHTFNPSIVLAKATATVKSVSF